MKFTEKSNPINTTYLKESLQTTKALKTNPSCRSDSSYTINTQNTAKTFKSVESLQSWKTGILYLISIYSAKLHTKA